MIEPGHKSTHLVKRKLSTQKKQELDAEAAKLPTLKQYVTRLLNRFATTATLTLGPKATTSSEKQATMKKIAQEAADKGFTIERNEWETK